MQNVFRRPFLAIALVLLTSLPTFARTPLSKSRLRLDESIAALPGASRAELAPADMAESMEFELAFQLRNADEFSQRTGRGERISDSEMQQKYYPLPEDYNRAVAWLKGQGFGITRTDPAHRLAVFAKGLPLQVSTSLGLKLEKVTFRGLTRVAAVTPPVLPSDIAGPLIGINGLQPQLRFLPHLRRKIQKPAPVPQVSNFAPPYTINAIMQAYNATSVAAIGTDETIGIVIDTFPNDSDLTQFWTETGVNQSLSNIIKDQVVSGTLPAPSGEETLDTEWTSGMAPGAKIHIYASKDLSFANLDQCYAKIIADAPNDATFHQVSISLGLGESYVSPSQITTDRQYFALMANSNITVFVSSGDGGSNPGLDGGPDGPTQVEYPASDIWVTAVGGTSLHLDASSGTVTSESAWRDGGGGVSTQSRQSWQANVGIGGNSRLVPDVSLAADPYEGALVVLNGSDQEIGGTSWSAPAWAGLCARVNQARVDATLDPIGLLGPQIYPLLGTTAFRDIVSGSNGLYLANAGFDLCTGLGVPNFAVLIVPLTGGPTPPVAPPAVGYGVITSPIPGSALTSSQLTFTWAAGTSSTAYWLVIGDDNVNEPGGSNIFSSSQTGGISTTVGNLPTDGRTLYVRLWSKINNQWYTPPQDYTYQAQPITVLTPVILPAGGSFKKKVKVTMSCATPGATISYTVNGGTPTTYTGPFTLATKGTLTIKATASSTNVTDSATATAVFKIK